MLLAAVEPRQAEALAYEVLRRAPADGLDEAASVAERALALASRELLRVDEAHRHLRRAISIAERAALPVRAAEARLSLALEHIHSGHPRAAWRELARAESALSADHPRLHNQVAVVLARLGRFDDALRAADRAVAGAERAGDPAERSLTLGNRGLVHAYRGSPADAERDLTAARDICLETGDDLGGHDMLHNLGWLAARQGDLPLALERLDAAEHGIAALGVPLAVYQLDRVEVLLAAGLHDEAIALSRRAAAELLDAGMHAELPELLLMHSRAALAAGDAKGALDAAEQGISRLGEQERPAWSLLAEAARLRALSATAPFTAVSDAARCADDLAAGGWRDEALELRVLAGVAALESGARAGEALLRTAATEGRSRSPRRRALAAHAAMTLDARHGRTARALDTARQALGALEDARATLGATELRVGSTSTARALTQSALTLAIRSRPAATVLRWSELARATSLLRPPVRPPDDAGFARDLDLLRAATHEREEMLLRGEPSIALDRRCAELELTVRRRARHARATDVVLPTPPTLARLREQLQGRVLVDYVDDGGVLHALVLTGRRTACVRLAPRAVVETELRHLRFALRRATSGDEAGLAAVRDSAARLDRLLVAPLGRLPRPGVVVVPAGLLHAMPWRLLPSLRDRTIEITPSVTMWSRDAAHDVAGGSVVVGGPGLAGALAEVAEVASRRPGATVLVGAAATTGRVLDALDGAGTAHLACHGRFRSDNPQFSSLVMADGPLLVYDLERLTVAPAHVVLSACDSARTAVRPGDEVLGLAAALLAAGTRSLVASVVPVPDAQTTQVMCDLHDAWDGRSAPVTALTEAAARAAGRSDLDALAAAAFNCFTAGQ